MTQSSLPPQAQDIDRLNQLITSIGLPAWAQGHDISAVDEGDEAGLWVLVKVDRQQMMGNDQMRAELKSFTDTVEFEAPLNGIVREPNFELVGMPALGNQE